MNKQLQLIFEYQTAPASLKDATKNYRQAETKLSKAEQALRDAEKALADAKAKLIETEKAFNAELNAWTPTGV